MLNIMHVVIAVEPACDVEADIVFVVDGSTSIGNDWEIFIEFIVDMVNYLPIGPDAVQVCQWYSKSINQSINQSTNQSIWSLL